MKTTLDNKAFKTLKPVSRFPANKLSGLREATHNATSLFNISIDRITSSTPIKGFNMASNYTT